MSIMPTHMSETCLRLVWKLRVILWYGQSVHVCSYGDNVDLVFAFCIMFFSLAFQIHDQASACAVPDVLLRNVKAYQRFPNQFLSRKFFETSLGVLVNSVSNIYHSINIASMGFHDFLMFLSKSSKPSNIVSFRISLITVVVQLFLFFI